MGMENGDLFSQMFLLRDFQSKRSSSWDISGGNKDWVVMTPGKTQLLLNEEKAGCVKHFYWTYIDPGETEKLNVFRGLVLRAFWDGEDEPSFEVPLGDFFGTSNGQVRPIRSLVFTANPGFDRAGRASWGFNCYLPMPFAHSARIEIENQGCSEHRLWFHIDYESYDESAPLQENVGQLHAQWHREHLTEAISPSEGETEIKNLSGDENYKILDTKGNGQFIGYFLTVVNEKREWWGEGDDMIFIDDEGFPPSIHGTGTEEIFGGGASPVTEYSGPYTGFHCIENRGHYDWWGTNGMYRFFINDPIRFRQSIRVTLEHGHGNDKANDYSSVAFWYQLEPHSRLPKLPTLVERDVNLQT